MSSVFFQSLMSFRASDKALHTLGSALLVLTFIYMPPHATASTQATVTTVQMCGVDARTGKTTCATCHPSTEEDIHRIENMCFQAYDDCTYFQWLFETTDFVLNQNFLDAFASSCYYAEIQVKTVISPTDGENKTPTLPATAGGTGQSVAPTENLMSSHDDDDNDDQHQNTKLTSPEAENKHPRFLANPTWRLTFVTGSIAACILFLIITSIMIKKRQVKKVDAQSVDTTQTLNLSTVEVQDPALKRDSFISATLQEQDCQPHESRKADAAAEEMRRPSSEDSETSSLLGSTSSIETEPGYQLNYADQRIKVSVLIDALQRTKRTDLSESLQSKTGDFTEKELRNVADSLGGEWEKLATYLEFKKSEIDRFKLDRHGRCEDAIFDMLVSWNRAWNRSQLQPCNGQSCRKDVVPKTIELSYEIVKEIKETPL